MIRGCESDGGEGSGGCRGCQRLRRGGVVVLGPAVEKGVVVSGVAAALEKVVRLVAGRGRQYEAAGAPDLPRRRAGVPCKRFWDEVWCGAMLAQKFFRSGCVVGEWLRFGEDGDGFEAVSGADAWA